MMNKALDVGHASSDSESETAVSSEASVHIERPRVRGIDASELLRHLAATDEELLLIDVRRADDFSTSRVKRAINLPLEKLSENGATRFAHDNASHSDVSTDDADMFLLLTKLEASRSLNIDAQSALQRRSLCSVCIVYGGCSSNENDNAGGGGYDDDDNDGGGGGGDVLVADGGRRDALLLASALAHEASVPEVLVVDQSFEEFADTYPSLCVPRPATARRKGRRKNWAGGQVAGGRTAAPASCVLLLDAYRIDESIGGTCSYIDDCGGDGDMGEVDRAECGNSFGSGGGGGGGGGCSGGGRLGGVSGDGEKCNGRGGACREGSNSNGGDGHAQKVRNGEGDNMHAAGFRVWVSGAAESADEQFILRERITHIINCTSQLPNVFPQHASYLKLDLEDEPAADLHSRLRECMRFLEGARAHSLAARRAAIGQRAVDERGRNGSSALIHCYMGASRAASVATAYVMMTQQRYDLDEALAFVKLRRAAIGPNWGFRQQLRRFAEELRIEAESKNIGTGK